MNNNLKFKNKFNTYQRFTDDKGLQNYESRIGIDHYLGIEVLELSDMGIQNLIAYNNGELWWSEVEPTTEEERERIKKVAEGYKDWHTPNVKEIAKIVENYRYGYSYVVDRTPLGFLEWRCPKDPVGLESNKKEKPTSQITITVPISLETTEEISAYVNGVLDTLKVND